MGDGDNGIVRHGANEDLVAAGNAFDAAYADYHETWHRVNAAQDELAAAIVDMNKARDELASASNRLRRLMDHYDDRASGRTLN